MPSIAPHRLEIMEIAGGVDTHRDTHTAAVIDMVGRVLGSERFPATAAGYVALLAWMRGFGQLVRVGVEGTGAYGAGLARLLRERDVCVAEVDRPRPQDPPLPGQVRPDRRHRRR
ncbi:IS110 family transposase [Nonomuraea cavernae]|uniref:IS110 family transposase n=1 Tax=Nonomuraea cavernae TaxID=2045107 RepID=UPI0033D0C199